MGNPTEYILKKQRGDQRRMDNISAVKTLVKGNNLLRIEKNEILSDYLEDVNRIVKCMCSVNVTSKNVYPSPNGLKVELSGICNFNVTYLGTGREKQEKLSFARISESFTHLIDMGSDTDLDREKLWCVCESVVKEASCRPLGPRKLQLSCDVDFNLCIKGNKNLSILGLGEDKGIKKKLENKRITSLKECFTEHISLANSFSVPQSYPSIDKLLEYDAKMFCKDLKTTDSFMEYEAILVLYCSYLPLCAEGEIPAPISFLQPLSVTKRIKKDLDPSSDLVLSDVTMIDVQIKLDDIEEGEKRKLDFSVEALCNAAIFSQEEMDICVDAYSTLYKSEPVKEEAKIEKIISLTEFLKRCEINFPLRCDKAEKLECVRATAEVMSCELEGKNVKAKIKFYVNLINVGNDSKLNYQSEELTSEVILELTEDIVKGSEGLSIEIFVDVKQIEAEYKGDGIYMRLELLGHMIVSDQQRLEWVKEVKCTEKIEEKGEKVIFCYPNAEESSWDIGKRYFVDCDDLEKQMENSSSILRIIV